MNSPKSINYETRPLKFTERKMLLATFARLCHKFGMPYQYIGFGGLAFTDFKLLHKELHIDNMHSIEGGEFSSERISFNNPYSFIKVYRELSTFALTKIDLMHKSIVWLDYDGDLDTYMFEDLELVLNKLPTGSMYLMTCNRQLKSSDSRLEYRVDEFREKFGALAPYELKAKNFTTSESYKTIRKMLLLQIKRIMDGRNKSQENVDFLQLFNIVYEENRGARMYTFGGLVAEKGTTINSLSLSDFSFIRTDETAYKIEIPNITFKEEMLINENIGSIQKIQDLEQKNIIDKASIDKYLEVYKFLPNFFDIRL